MHRTSAEYDEQYESIYNNDYNKEPYQIYHHKHRHETFPRENSANLPPSYGKKEVEEFLNEGRTNF